MVGRENDEGEERRKWDAPLRRKESFQIKIVSGFGNRNQNESGACGADLIGKFWSERRMNARNIRRNGNAALPKEMTRMQKNSL